MPGSYGKVRRTSFLNVATGYRLLFSDRENSPSSPRYGRFKFFGARQGRFWPKMAKKSIFSKYLEKGGESKGGAVDLK